MARPLPRPVLCGVPHPPPRSPFRPVPLLAAPAAVGSRPVSFAQQAWPRAGRPSRCLKGGRRRGGGNPQGEGLRPLRQKGESPLHTQAPGLRGLAGAGRRCSLRPGAPQGPGPLSAGACTSPGRIRDRPQCCLVGSLRSWQMTAWNGIPVRVSFIKNQKPGSKGMPSNCSAHSDLPPGAPEAPHP